jgi:GT2 family glycosyltransferase
MALVDVVVVSYHSRETLRGCVEELAAADGIHVIVVDNASSDGSLETIRDLPVTRIAERVNAGFSHGCNAGWRAGAAPYVVFLNPDARITPESVETLARVLETERRVGVVAPRIDDSDGGLDLSQRRFPRLRSTFAHAFFLNRVLPEASWTSELVTERAAYERTSSPDWVSGACLMTRRDLLESLGGWDDGFLLYCEDQDLCRRVRDAGFDVRFEPAAAVRHEGGASAPRTALTPVLAASRVRYARKHHGPVHALLERIGIAVSSCTHMVVTRSGRAGRVGHAQALLVAAGLRPARLRAGD